MLRGDLPHYFSHYPILAAAVAASSGPILELGVGHGSTYMLHYMGLMSKRRVVSAETDKAWLEGFRDGYESPLHEFVHVTDWPSWNRIESEIWGAALVDCAPGEERYKLADRLRHVCRWIVCHDSEKDYGSGGNYMYEKILPRFRFVSEWRRCRPYTFVLSDYAAFPIEDCDRKWEPPKP